MSLKKLNQMPSGPVPEVYKVNQPTKSTEQTTETKINEENTQENTQENTLFNYNLKKVKSFNNIRRSGKLLEQEQLFETGVYDKFLKFLDPNNHQLDIEILIGVLQMAEEYFVYGNKEERTTAKEASIRKMVTPYFRDDIQILEMMISSVWKHIYKTNWFKRLKRKSILGFKKIINSFFLK